MQNRLFFLSLLCRDSLLSSGRVHRPQPYKSMITLESGNYITDNHFISFVKIDIYLYTSSPFLFTDYPLYFFCLQFTAQTVIFDNVARDRYLTKDFNNSLGNEVRPNWKSRNTGSTSKLYFDISTIYHAFMWHNSSAFLLPVMTFHKEFGLVTLIFKFQTDPE